MWGRDGTWQRQFGLKIEERFSSIHPMLFRFLQSFACVVVMLTTLSCTSTVPTAEELDKYSQILHQRAEPEFAELRRQRTAGQITQETYEAGIAHLENRIRQETDNLAWARHNMAESRRKALGIPTPDKPVALTPPVPGVNSANSLYRPATQQFNAAAGTTVNQTSAALLPRTSQGFVNPAPRYPGTGGIGVDPYYQGGGY